MILTIKDRLTIIGILPSEGNLCEMVDIYDLVKLLKLSDEEKALVCYSENGQAIKWDATKDPMKEIVFSNDLKDIFTKAVDKLDMEGKINLNLVETILKVKNG